MQSDQDSFLVGDVVDPSQEWGMETRDEPKARVAGRPVLTTQEDRTERVRDGRCQPTLTRGNVYNNQR